MTLSKRPRISEEASKVFKRGGDVGDVKREDLWHPEKGYLFHATAGLLLEFSNKSNETGEM